MALQNVIGDGLWIPNIYGGYQNNVIPANNDTVTLDADEEEYQIIGRVRIDGGGSKTFGTSGSKLSWMAGASITFQATATLRIGVKQASSIDTANGPTARATIGAAAFDVYDDLVGGTDTITSSTWRNETMSAGTPFTVANGDLIAICWHLDITASAQSIKIRQSTPTTGGVSNLPAFTLVTSGPTYTGQTQIGNCILTFDDGTLGWVDPTIIKTTADTASATIGNTNIYGNIFQVPFSCKIDAIAAQVLPSTSAANFALELYSTPLGTPALVESVACDANVCVSVTSARTFYVALATPRTLSINTDYCVGIQQTTATAVTTIYYDVNDAAHFKPNGMGAECYAANSTAGATFSAQNSGKRRYRIWARISALDDGVSAGSGGFPVLGGPFT